MPGRSWSTESRFKWCSMTSSVTRLGDFKKVLCDKSSGKSSLNISSLFVPSLMTPFLKNELFWVLFGQLLVPISGHTDYIIYCFAAARSWFTLHWESSVTCNRWLLDRNISYFLQQPAMAYSSVTITVTCDWALRCKIRLNFSTKWAFKHLNNTPLSWTPSPSS